ncbi:MULTISPECIES: caspase family protein [Pseudomonadota]|uniref:Peptidase C14 caspase domain-containing protein n=1 Tax=Achromobacter ruhlandii TaxID=72557 RepID=A0ABM8LN66_9BURK|nr:MULTISPECIES: caspase family protein [Pseudomonadota]EBV7315868.1 caspase family protein [Salmonella enterica subsp. enterica serovar Ohio]MBH4348208.1 caspase family protein [Pseudomonas aeruginosa]EBV7338914.1 caspase family protein [Salmonella enterica subsp. enterica serovar Ohio]MBT1934788.1 caspase family protein [Enterobacter chengduensis]MBT1963044.1 caspase family protein [Enterobacter chengduensis]
MRIALIVGINHYEHGGSLYGCVDDAHAVQAVLARHGDGSVNFDCKMFTGTGPTDRVERSLLKDRVEELFKAKADIALFYFAGHGHIEATGGYLLATDSRRGDEGLSLSEVLALANKSPARNKIVILDSCHSGIAGTPPVAGELASLSEGLTILTASAADQYATEENGRGVFTTLLVDALHGGAANLTGDITPGSIYAHVDQSLGAWEQRPIFKTNVRQFVSLRKVNPPISLDDLRRITEFFPRRGFEYKLDPTFEPELKGRDPGMPPPDQENTRKFALLQRYNRLNLVTPVDAPHMWHAAMQSKSCKLTVLGEHYRLLAEKQRL